MMRSVYSLRSLNILAAVVVTLVCADVASAQEDGAAGLAAENEAAQVADAPPAVAEAGDAGSDVVSGAEADPLAADADAMGDASGEAAAVE